MRRLTGLRRRLDGLGRSLGVTPSEGGGTLPVPTNYQLIANYTGIPNGTQVAMSASYTSNQGRNGHQMGRVGARSIRIVDQAIRIQSGAGTEASLPATDTTYERALEKGAASNRLLYDGANSVVLASGQMVISDPIDIRLEADEVFYTRFLRSVADTSYSLSAMDIVGLSQQGFRTSGASQLLSSGAMNTSGTGGGPAFMPTLILGIPDTPLSAVLLTTDSIGNKDNDTNTATTAGFLNRAFLSVSGHAVPVSRHTVGGNTLNAQQPANAPKQLLALPYVTDNFIHLGTNDIGNVALTGTAAERFAVLQARFTNIATAIRATMGPYGKRVRVHASSIIRRSSFDATQEATRVMYNDWLAAGAGGLLDQYYDIVAAAGDPATYSDGIHPASSDHINMADVVSTGFAPYLNPYYGV